MNLFKKTGIFFKEVKAELIQVSWSTRQELIATTIALIIIILIVATFIGSIDLFLSRILSWLFR
ncbi:MAG: preprotein translocase subunit SecE [Candidatus Omnitrophica bacterium]|nr:preprotein translocase subunit SecE [Candidatus Omnitrophota bacterium]